MNAQELNERVAIEVMGMRKPTDREVRTEAEETWLHQPSCRVFLKGFMASPTEDGKVSQWWWNIPRYSEEISAAFIVVAAMRAKGWRLVLSDGRDDDDESHIEASFCSNHPTVENWLGYTAYAPLGQEARAICLAALTAIQAAMPKTEGQR